METINIPFTPSRSRHKMLLIYEKTNERWGSLENLVNMRNSIEHMHMNKVTYKERSSIWGSQEKSQNDEKKNISFNSLQSF